MTQDRRTSDEDLAAVRRALEARGIAGKDVRAHGAVLLDDIAEATGLPRDEVQRHLDRIRSETAWTAPAKSHVNPFAVAGVLALVAALGSLWVRTRPTLAELQQQELLREMKADRAHTAQLMSTGVNAFRTKDFQPAMAIELGEGSVHPPAGISIHIIAGGKGISAEGYDSSPTVYAIRYQEEVDGVLEATESLLALLPRVSQRMFQAPPGFSSAGPSNGLSRDGAQVVFRPRPGQAHVTFDGWPGQVDFFVPAPLPDGTLSKRTIEAVRSGAERFLAAARRDQEEGQRVDVDPERGVVLPPPGLTVEFDGRRSDEQSGARLAFSDIDASHIAQRLALSIRNAFIRDHQPPIGGWTSSADVDRNAPIPTKSVVKLSRKDNIVTFDLPTSAKWTPGDDRIVDQETRAFAAQVANELHNHEADQHATR